MRVIVTVIVMLVLAIKGVLERGFSIFVFSKDNKLFWV